ncbi:glycoside hydrolase family 2 TIM barrel-domain containing protein [Kitasatospora sp. NPDC059327]|uniref:glycoside hydrolase family 2 protein n=1 Tax=Kitasatospora sp. NPDC059327 TaxID=3346803 RepID=UPI00367A0AE2
MKPHRRTPLTQPDTSQSDQGFSRRTALKGLAAIGLVAAGPGQVFLAAPAYAATTTATPVVPPLPETVSGVSSPKVPIVSGWRYTSRPPVSFWSAGTNTSSWSSIQVPGEPALQGQNVPSNAECAYRTTIAVPADYAGKTILLRFDGVYSYARVWVNGTLVRTHDGGFTTWYADITSSVTPGQQATLTVGVTDRPDSIAGQSAYSKHTIGGILRDVTLVALPASHLTRLHVDTTFDATYTNATLTVTAAAAGLAAGASGTVSLSLTDPAGRQVALSPSTITLTGATPQAVAAIPVTAPLKWDAEHPNLYTLRSTYQTQGQSQTVSQQVGFRQVKIVGNKLLVNGKPVTLLGVCHHSMTEALGRATTPALEEQALRLYKEANCNFVRTTHYPPTTALLDWADRIGLYVEVEAPVCFQGGTVDDPAYEGVYLAQYAEMLERDRSRACVIEWALGNESGVGGVNFYAERAYSRQTDPSRPTVFEDRRSDSGGPQADIYSGHYPSVGGPGNASQPIQYGEFAHVACYNRETLRVDPAVRDFWGKSIAKFATWLRTTDGIVGGAIWAAIDEVFNLPAGSVGYGEWGIIDLHRRRKPEFWLTQKAFSPVQIADGTLAGLTPGGAVPVNVTNWYDHSNLGELAIAWRIGSRSGTLGGVNIAARQSGTLTVPAGPWSAGDVLQLTFRRGTAVVDDYRLSLNTPATPAFTPVGGTTPTVQETANRIIVTGVDKPFTVVFDKVTARLVEATVSGTRVLTGGPDLIISRLSPGPWTGVSTTVTTSGGQAIVTLTGRFGTINTSIKVAVDGRGLLTTTYTIANPPGDPVTDVGLAYMMTGKTDTLTWQRDAQWTVYPADHIGRTAGTAVKWRASGTDGYRTQPTWPWSQDTHSYDLFGKNSAAHWTNDFRGTKINVRLAKATAGSTGPGAQVESGGTDAVRLAPVNPPVIDNASPQVVYNGTWTKKASAGGAVDGRFGTEAISNVTGATAQLTFTGSGVALYASPRDDLGIVKISIDGAVAASVDLYGTGKAPAQLVFRSAPLTYGQHTIRVECTGTKNAASSGTSALVNAFRVVNQIIDDADSRVLYTGNWTHDGANRSSTTSDLGRTESYSKEVGATATTAFWGAGVRVIAPKGPSEGIVEVSVDGGVPTRVDLYAASKQSQQNVFERTGLVEGEHTVTVRVTGQKNSSATDTFVCLDAFEVLIADPFTPYDPGVNLITSARLAYTDLDWGNPPDKAIRLSANYTATTRMRLVGG